MAAEVSNVRVDFLLWGDKITKYSKTFAVNPECTDEQIMTFVEVLISFIPEAYSAEVTRIDSNGLGTVYHD